MIRKAALSVFIVFLLLSGAFAEESPLRVGIMPFNSAMALFKTHQPLRLHLQTQLGRPIELYTSSGYPSHVEDVLSCKFDILITGPHFGVMSMEKGYQPLVQYKTRLKPLFVVRKDSGITDVEGSSLFYMGKLKCNFPAIR